MIFKRLKKPDMEKEKTLRNEIEKAGGLEKGDLPAMILSALLVIMPVAILALMVLAIVMWLFI